MEFCTVGAEPVAVVYPPLNVKRPRATSFPVKLNRVRTYSAPNLKACFPLFQEKLSDGWMIVSQLEYGPLAGSPNAVKPVNWIKGTPQNAGVSITYGIPSCCTMLVLAVCKLPLTSSSLLNPSLSSFTLLGPSTQVWPTRA